MQAFDNLANQLNAGLAQINQRLAQINQRLDAIDQRFDAVDQRFDAVDQRFDAVDQRLDEVLAFSRNNRVILFNRHHATPQRYLPFYKTVSR